MFGATGLQPVVAAIPQLRSLIPIASACFVSRSFRNLFSTNASVQTLGQFSTNSLPRVHLVEQQPKDDAAAREGAYLQSLSEVQQNHPLEKYRSGYPESMWSKVIGAFAKPKYSYPLAVDMGVGTGKGALELTRRGFRVVGVENDPLLLARTHTDALKQGMMLNLITSRMQHSMLPAGCADLVSFLHGLHLVNADEALHESHRILKDEGILVAAWNDRDLSSSFIQHLEDLLEKYNPQYSRYCKQRDVHDWGDVLCQGDLFRLQEYSVHPNPLPMKNAIPLLDILDAMSFVRSATHSSQRKREFHKEVVALVQKHFGSGKFLLPLETKLYLLHRNDNAGPTTQ